MTELRKPPVSEKGVVPIFGPGAASLMDSNQAAQFLDSWRVKSRTETAMH